jgi:hypothetical protein
MVYPILYYPTIVCFVCLQADDRQLRASLQFIYLSKVLVPKYPPYAWGPFYHRKVKVESMATIPPYHHFS